MTPAQYIARGIPVFPCHPEPGLRKTPLTPNGFKGATTDPAIVRAWETKFPGALWGMPTGKASGIVVLDIDVKRPEANGLDSLEDLGRSILPGTPLAHTQTNGLHVYFRCPDRELRNSAGKIGPGLDVRGDGGYVIVPTPDSGYRWDTYWNLDTVEPVAAPDWLWPPPSSRPSTSHKPLVPCEGLSPYGEAAIESACDAIVRAGPGYQEQTLNSECFSIGTLAGAEMVPAGIALRTLLRAAFAMPDHDPRWPWRAEEIDLKVRRAFADGLRHPREARCVVR